MSSVIISDCLQSVHIQAQICLLPSEQKQKVKPRYYRHHSPMRCAFFLKQGERARTVRTAANTETTRCYICIWCYISLPVLPICSLPANKMDVIISNKTWLITEMCPAQKVIQSDSYRIRRKCTLWSYKSFPLGNMYVQCWKKLIKTEVLSRN